ncbi:heavy metal-associated isoprenylated plant protein 4-like [Solanum stenotomum]|uniref:heavy metal-associated isoprenylated plant protein 4-like n=1 Tax=Solanum stenotomum TaxID=172797 RepID=UPI0020D17FDC|nr:heavy metal-associated isoprenylated plant protein 4-like [Solanum stenotomum]
MVEIDNYQDNSAQSSDYVESSNNKSDNEDEDSIDTQTGDEDEEPLSLPICVRDISGLNCSPYPCDAKLKKVLENGENFYYKVTKNNKITATKLMRLIKMTHRKNDNIIEGDPFKHKGKSTKVVHPYLTCTVREIKKNYLATLKSYVDEVKDIVLDALKANLKVTDLAINDDNFSAPTVVDEILPLAIVDDDLDAVDEYFAEEVDEVVEEKKEEEMKEEEKEQDKEKMTENEKEKLEENDEKKKRRS